MTMKSHLQYLSYVLRHKWYVFLACLEYGLIWRGIVHDWTKFLPVEWTPYVRFFYGHGMTRGQAAALNYDFPVSDADELAFENAWNHHQRCNDHHWQYWLECDPIVSDPTYCQCLKHMTGRVPIIETRIRFGDDGTAFCLTCLNPFPVENVHATRMSDVCCKEMVADWRGAGRALGKPYTWEWYKANKDKMNLHPLTRFWVEMELRRLRHHDWVEQGCKGSLYG